MSWRRLAVLISQLPPDSATAQTEDLDGVTRWGQPEELMAQIVDELRTWRYEYALGNTPKGRPRPKEPDMFPRPKGVRRG